MNEFLHPTTVDVWDLSGSGVVTGTSRFDVTEGMLSESPQVRQSVTTLGWAMEIRHSMLDGD
jgi:hypothetical protein